MSTITFSTAALDLADRFRRARQRTLELVKPLTPEDMMVQSCPEASPAKWHLAHTAWFFESFILREFLGGYRVFNEDFAWLFNSYYQSFEVDGASTGGGKPETAFPEKRLRSSFSRPGIDEILRFRQHVDEGIERLLERGAPQEAVQRIALGIHHEEQHQELLLTDILNAFFTNPLRPTYKEQGSGDRDKKLGAVALRPMKFVEFKGGLREAGHAGEDFCFDNELPRHRVWLEPYELATRLVTCGEFADFMRDDGYRRPELWLSAGWDALQQNGWRAPLYWTKVDETWSIFTLRGEESLEQRAGSPVSHVSFFEADAYARWTGLRLATEFEWESAAASGPVEGNLLESGKLEPEAVSAEGDGAGVGQCFGDCWEWTGSAYLGYPGFQALPGSLGEYNGKFMSGQMVLRGGSCVTPKAHIRASYRNFFSPETRWQFSGIRLAK
ncbi:MAG TPA: ergothioneine biosynthesis protein EgtB [Terracidiphilus sp.]|nr:ergothioneine biosynthesis protein EgtB [Terracidiphilus sp.]